MRRDRRSDRMKKVLVAMSGGVDSSVAAKLLLEQGYECIGVTMKLVRDTVQDTSAQRTCCSLEDVEDARSVAFRLGIPYYVFNFSDVFEEEVIDRFISSYEAGETPNPCIDCNRYIKFERLYRRSLELGCDLVATGHYARSVYDEKSGRWLLLRGKNTQKDQSYVLCFLTQKQLAHTIFPLGEYEDKEQIRKIAERFGFINAHKHDSQDICFVPDGDYAAFIEARTGKKYPPGDFTDTGGQVLGCHKGIIRYTIGQRRGLGLSLKQPMYVCRKDMEANRVILCEDHDLYRRELTARDFNWISMAPPAAGTKLRVTAKPRYRAKEAEATANVLADGKVRVIFDEPQRALTAGQAVVLYDREAVIGGGTICEERE